MAVYDWYDLAGVGRLRLVVPTYDQLRHIDDEWPQNRPDDDESHGWRWCKITLNKRNIWLGQRFGLEDEQGVLLAVWWSRKSSAINLPCGAAFRLDRLEVAPGSRSKRLGGLSLSLAAEHTIRSLNASILVLGSVPSKDDFYKKFKGIAGKVEGWTHPAGTTPFTFDQEALNSLVRFADAQREKQA